MPCIRVKDRKGTDLTGARALSELGALLILKMVGSQPDGH